MGSGFSPAVFLDRDGVLVEDVELLTDASEIRILPGVVEALAMLKEAGYALLVVSNQTVVARGLLDEAGVRVLEAEVETRLVLKGAPPLDGFYFCPHHPKATVSVYRQTCECRKPRPGMLLKAAEEHGIDLSRSFMVGDRPTDLLAGQRAGCRTIWVKTGQHEAPIIETREDPVQAQPDHVCLDLLEAAKWIMSLGPHSN